MDFLAENNLCGQSILTLVSRGNSIIAELLRLKDAVPPQYRLRGKYEQQRYATLLPDFSYFRSADDFERAVEADEALRAVDDELKDSYLELLGRFYGAFESVHRYVVDLTRFLEDVEEGLFIQQTLESVFANRDGKQVMCEALYLYGVMLLLVDRLFPGEVRERLLVSYYRYSAERKANESNVDDVCKLLRSTGYSSSARRPPGYPEDYFGRVPLDEKYVSMVIGRLRSDDIYSQLAKYSVSEDRSTALSGQASMLYVCLYFCPAVLRDEAAKMRGIVDKFFNDNWVIGVYMGMVVNLVESWEPYRAAKMALQNTIQTSMVKDMTSSRFSKMEILIKETHKWLSEGTLVEENVLDEINKLVNLLRECNVTHKWLMLHTTELGAPSLLNKRCKQLRDIVVADSKYEPFSIFQLLVNTAQLELMIKDMYGKILVEREKRWVEYRQECSVRTTELAEVFEGNQKLNRIKKNDKLRNWFIERGKQISELDLSDALSAGRLIIQLIQAFSEAQEFHQLESNLQVKQYLMDIDTYLHKMVKIVGVKEDTLITMEIVGDLSYAWEIIDNFTEFMQNRIKEDPFLVGKLRAIFLKLASAMEIPILRISQARSGDMISVSQHYSNELVSYVRKVLQIIPQSMFKLLEKIIYLQTEDIVEVPTRLDKDKLKNYAQLDKRFQVAKLTHAISVFTDGILAMKTTLVGVIKVDPKKILEDGIRKELVVRVTKALHENTQFNVKIKTNELYSKLDALGKIMDGFKRSFEYIQDYINISGLKIWQEEVSRIINFNVEQEANFFLKEKVPEWKSVYQSKRIPIPMFPSTDNISATFIGRLAQEVLKITDPKVTLYVDQMRIWYDFRSKEEVASLNLFHQIEDSFGTFGLAGLDRLLGLKAVATLQNCVKLITKLSKMDGATSEVLSGFANSLVSTDTLISNPTKFYGGFVSRLSKSATPIFDLILHVGQLQLLRRELSHQLLVSSRFDAKPLLATLQTLNLAILEDCRRDDSDSSAGNDSNLLYELGTYLQWVGKTDPLSQIYITSILPSNMSMYIFLFLTHYLPKMTFMANAGGLVSKKFSDPVDGVPFLLGIVTLMKQFHNDNSTSLVSMLAQFIRSHLEHAKIQRMTEMPQEVVNCVVFLEKFVQLANINRSVISRHVPTPIMHQVKNQLL